MTKSTGSGFPGDRDIQLDVDLRRLLSTIDDELGEERQSRDDDFTAQEHLDVRMNALDNAVRHVLDDGP